MSEVTVIIPAFNVENCIERAIRSVKSQTIIDWDLLIVNDGSTDGTGTLCDMFSEQDSRIKVLHTENNGPYSARITGVKASKTEYVVFLDGDDFLESNALQVLLDESKCGADVVISQFDKVWQDGSVRGESYDEEYKEVDRDTVLNRMISKAFGGVFHGNLYRRRLFEHLNESKSFFYMEDLLCNWKVFNKANSFLIIPNVTYHYYQNEKSIVHRDFSSLKITGLEVLSCINEDIIGKYPKLTDKFDSFFIKNYISILCAWIINKGINEEQQQYIDILKEKVKHTDILLSEQEKDMVSMLFNYKEGSLEDGIRNLKKILIRYAEKHKKIYIYGAGKIAKTLSKLMDEAGINFVDYVVSDGESLSSTLLGAHLVIHLSSFLKKKEQNIGLIMALQDRYYTEVLASFKACGVEDYLDLREYNNLLIF